MPVQELRLVLTMKDFDRAIAFYRDTLGLRQLAAWEDGGGHGVLLDGGRATLEIFDEAQARAIDILEVGRPVAGQVRLGFQAADGDSLADDLAAAGAEILGGPVVTPWGDRNVRLLGPEGIQLTLFATPEKV
jgi:catechol 2,3-dioxygenase-like lactoylglutathione lyase family enzyme